jgi:hypothetical protein
MTLKFPKFETLMEEYKDQVQNRPRPHGVSPDDIVTIKKGAENDPRLFNIKEKIAEIREKNITLRVTELKPDTDGSVKWVLVKREDAPGLRWEPLLIPIEFLEVEAQEQEQFQKPINDRLKYDKKAEGAQEVPAVNANTTSQNKELSKFDVTLKGVNSKIPVGQRGDTTKKTTFFTGK